MASIPADLQWQCIRNTSSFIHVARGVNKRFSREPMNLKGVNSFRYNGLIHKQSIGVQPAKDGKGVTLVYRANGATNKPGKNHKSLTLNRNSRRTMKTIRKFMVDGHYRPALTKLAQRRASQLIRGQKPVVAKKKRGSKKSKAE